MSHKAGRVVGAVLAITVLGLIGLAIFTAVRSSDLSSELSDLNAAINGSTHGLPCGWKANNHPAHGKRLDPPITLTAEPAVGVANFATSRGSKSLYFVLKASRPLPPSVKPAQIEISVPRPPQRSGETLESTSLPLPRFSHPRFINDRKAIQFRMCIDGHDLKPGTYTSQVFIGGPKGLHETSVTAAITAKSGLFWLIGPLILAAAATLLWVMVSQDMGGDRLGLRLLTIVASLVAAAAAMYAVYSANNTWGEDVLTSFFALGGTAFGAAGVSGFVTTIFKSGAQGAGPQAPGGA